MRATGGVGVAMATSAWRNQHGHRHRHCHARLVSVVCITGQVSSKKLLGSDAFQEIDITGITMYRSRNTTSFVVSRRRYRSDVPGLIIANSGRPAPFFVDITKDAQQTLQFDGMLPLSKTSASARDNHDQAEFDRAVELLNTSGKRP
jgi:acetolactate synthase-1/2/3 large subunit